MGAGLFLLALLFMPLVAGIILTNSIRWEILAAYFPTVWAITFWLYWKDKRSARLGEWRVPENMLHFFELVGGWPSAFVAQRLIRHKTVKKSYQVVFWLIVAIHQYVAVDSLLRWRLGQAIMAWLMEIARP